MKSRDVKIGHTYQCYVGRDLRRVIVLAVVVPPAYPHSWGRLPLSNGGRENGVRFRVKDLEKDETVPYLFECGRLIRDNNELY